MADLGEIGIDRIGVGPRNRCQLSTWASFSSQTDNGRMGIVFTGSIKKRGGTYQRLIIAAPLGSITGTVKEEGVFVSRLVRCYRKSDGLFCSEALSDPVTGAFSIPNLKPGVEYFLVAFDAAGDPSYNALIYDGVFPV